MEWNRAPEGSTLRAQFAIEDVDGDGFIEDTEFGGMTVASLLAVIFSSSCANQPIYPCRARPAPVPLMGATCRLSSKRPNESRGG